ncbi:hypothetical protein [Luteolibacter soli]|uniref:Uncharacterized protein n=1 Tax=Luteolibacter soli TaxID=3135280 RepID=A0ABU9B4W3_9BACT
MDTDKRFAYLNDLPFFVGTLPTSMNANRVGDVLWPLLLSHLPASIAFKIDLPRAGRRREKQSDGSFISGFQPRIQLSQDHPHDVECSVGMMRIVARRVTDLVVVGNEDGSETVSWTEARRFWRKQNHETGEAYEEEIMPERRREETLSMAQYSFH